MHKALIKFNKFKTNYMTLLNIKVVVIVQDNTTKNMANFILDLSAATFIDSATTIDFSAAPWKFASSSFDCSFSISLLLSTASSCHIFMSTRSGFLTSASSSPFSSSCVGSPQVYGFPPGLFIELRDC